MYNLPISNLILFKLTVICFSGFCIYLILKQKLNIRVATPVRHMGCKGIRDVTPIFIRCKRIHELQTFSSKQYKQDSSHPVYLMEGIRAIHLINNNK